MSERPRVLLLGGVDPSGGAGLTLDVQVVARLQAQPLPVPVVLTAQNRRGFHGAYPVSDEVWQAAFAAACDDGEVAAVKVGLLAAAETVASVGAALQPLAGRVPIVIDPVLSATAGGFDASAELAAAYRRHLVPLASLLTPNRPEIEVLFDGAATAALQLGANAVLCKGGHGSEPEIEDELLTADGAVVVRHARLDIGPVRGTGCALASAIAARLAAGDGVEAACQHGIGFLADCLQRMGPAAADGLPRVLAFD